jgi:hypothetical protein
MKKKIMQGTLLLLAFTLFAIAVEAVGWMDGFSGLVIRIFLGYCAIIVVCQVFGAMIALRQGIGERVKRRRATRQVAR